MLKSKIKVSNIIIFMMLSIGAFTMIFPFLWMISTSLKEAKFVYQFPPQWIPNPIDWKNYVEIWSIIPLASSIKNSLIVAVIVLVIGTFTSSLSAFSFAKMNFPHKDLYFLAILATMMVPFIVMMIPEFIVYSKIGWIDTLFPLIVPGTLGNVSMIFFLRQYMMGLSNELMDAGKIDGCNFFRIYRSIFLPLCKPAIAANVILMFMSIWNDYLTPLVFINSPDKMTVQVIIAMLNSYYAEQTDFPIIMVASVISVAPILIVFISCQKYFVESFAMTGIKG
ncbi:MAG: carbohydrate ABC transporter permease [Mobilitalea sp.]